MRRARAGVVLAATVAVLATLLGDTSGAQAGPSAALLHTQLKAASPFTVPGGDAQFVAVAANTSTATVAAPTLQLTASATLTFAGVAGATTASTRWHCKGSGHAVTCSAPPLGARATSVALLRFHVSPAAGIGSTASLSAGGDRAAMHVRAGKPAPFVVSEVAGDGSVAANGQARETLNVLNVGSGAARSVTVSSLLPRIAGAFSGSGSGWRCGGGSCTYSGTLEPGRAAPQLVLRWSPAPNRVASLDLHRGGKGALQTWTVVTASGGSTTSAAAAIIVTPPPGALLVPLLAADGGRQDVLPGSATTIHAKISNVGGAPTEGRLQVAVTVPAGVAVAAGAWACSQTATEPSPSFACLAPSGTSIPAGRTIRLDLVAAVAEGARPVRGAVVVTAAAENDVTVAQPRTASLPFSVLEGNVGIPALTLFRAVGAEKLEPARDGNAAELHRNVAFTERLDVRNGGGAAILAGSDAELTQTFSAGVSLRSLRAPPGWRCSFGGTTLTCALRFASALEPAATLEGPTVVVSDSSTTNGERSWTATIRLAAAGAPRPYRLPVLVDVVRGHESLDPNWTTGRVPTAGGTGAFGVSVANLGDGATSSPVRLGLSVPAGVRIAEVDDARWSCVVAPSKTSARCTSDGPAGPGERLGRIHVVLAFGRGTAGRTLILQAHASDGDARATKATSATQIVVPRRPVRAVIKAPNHLVFEAQPLVRANATVTPTPVTLEGDGSGGSGSAVGYRWTQRSGPPVKWLNQPAGVTEPTSANVVFAAPPVTKLTALTFRLTVSDGSASDSAFVRVRVAPLPSAAKGFDFKDAHPKAERQLGATHVKRALPKPAVKVAPAPRKKPKDDNGPTAPTTTNATGAVPQIFCDLVNEALAAKNNSFSASVAGFSLHLNNVHVEGTTCDASTTITFSGSTFGVHSVRATGIDGAISQDGIELTAGKLDPPDAWNAPTLSIAGGGITIAFGEGSSSASGTVSGKGFAFVPLPSGWSGTTSLTFDGGDVTAHAEANGPNGANATVDGAIDDDGTFALSVDVQHVVQLQGAAIDVAGRVKRTEPGGPLSVSLSGDLDGALQIVPGLSVADLHVKMEPTETKLGITGSGIISLALPSKALDIAVGFRYGDPADWSLTAKRTGDDAFTPVPGLTLHASDFTGGIVAKDDSYDLTLRYEQSEAWHPADGVSVSNLVVDLSNTCHAEAGACPTDARLFLAIAGDAAVRLPGAGTLDAQLAGAIALPSGDFGVSAKLNSALTLGAGVAIENAAISISRGLKAPKEEPSFEPAPGGLEVDVSGTVSVPGIGTLPTVHASYSDQGWAVAAPLGSFSLPGASGDGSKISGTVLGWASYSTSIKVFDAAKDAYVTIPIPADTFKLSGSFTTPPWLKTMLGLPGDVSARITGTINPSANEYALRMEFGLAGDPYLVGNADSATSVRLKSTFFEVEAKSGSFNLALGGTATLAVKGSATTAASSIDLTVALSYAAATTTVAGSLSLDSRDGWRDAFGANDLTLYGFSVTFQLNLASLVPGLGVAASAVLPGNVRNSLGVVNGARTTLVANLSITNPCLGVSVDDPNGGNANVLSIGNGALTAKQFDFYVAPSGCTVGQFTYQAGFSLNFDGAVGGVPLTVKARLTLAPLAFDGSADLGEFAVGGMTIKKTHVEVGFSSSRLRVAFSGGVEVFGTNVDLAGSLEKTNTGVVADFRGTLDQLTIGSVLSARAIVVTAKVDTAKSQFDFGAKGSINLLGATADADFKLSLADGQLNAAKADIRANIPIGGANGVVLTGVFKVDYQKNKPISIDATATVKVSGYNLASATVTVRPEFISVSGSLALGGVFTANLDGTVYFKDVPTATITSPSGARTSAKAGDFTLSASNVTLNLGGFSATGSVAVGKAGTNAWASVDATMQLLGTGSGNSVSVAGSFESNGNFSFSGSANLDLLGFTPTMNVSVVKTGTSVSVTGAASVTVLGSSVNIDGAFEYANGNYRYRLNGTGTLNVGGYTLANAQIKLSNFPEDAGFSASVDVKAGDVLTASGRINFEAGGRFSLSASAYIAVLGVTANVSFANYEEVCRISGLKSWFPLRFSYACSNRDISPTLKASATIDKSGFSFAASLTVSADGSFSATARTPVSGETVQSTGTLDLWVVKGYAEISYHMELGISSSAPHLTVDGKGTAKIWWAHRTWTWSWSDWDVLVGASLSIKTDPFSACAYATLVGKDVGGCI